MAPRPSFNSEVRREGDNLIVSGTSQAPQEVLDIHVILAQKERVPAPAARVARIGSFWEAVLPAEKFVPGPAVAFGVEVRGVNATTTTWVGEVNVQ